MGPAGTPTHLPPCVATSLGAWDRLPPPATLHASPAALLATLEQVWLVKLEGVESPEEAALLRGHSLLIPASARQALEDEDEFYVQVGGCIVQPWMQQACV